MDIIGELGTVTLSTALPDFSKSPEKEELIAILIAGMAVYVVSSQRVALETARNRRIYSL